MIDDLTLGEIKELNNLFGNSVKKNQGNDYPPHIKLGMNLFIRTVTHILVGKLEWLGEKEFSLSNCSWIAETGRYHSVLQNGFSDEDSSEIEPYPENLLVTIGRGSLIDMCEWVHSLPSQAK
jgi:hypothetical protein